MEAREEGTQEGTPLDGDGSTAAEQESPDDGNPQDPSQYALKTFQAETHGRGTAKLLQASTRLYIGVRLVRDWLGHFGPDKVDVDVRVKLDDTLLDEVYQCELLYNTGAHYYWIAGRLLRRTAMGKWFLGWSYSAGEGLVLLLGSTCGSPPPSDAGAEGGRGKAKGRQEGEGEGAGAAPGSAGRVGGGRGSKGGQPYSPRGGRGSLPAAAQQLQTGPALYDSAQRLTARSVLLLGGGGADELGMAGPGALGQQPQLQLLRPGEEDYAARWLPAQDAFDPLITGALPRRLPVRPAGGLLLGPGELGRVGGGGLAYADEPLRGPAQGGVLGPGPLGTGLLLPGHEPASGPWGGSGLATGLGTALRSGGQPGLDAPLLDAAPPDAPAALRPPLGLGAQGPLQGLAPAPARSDDLHPHGLQPQQPQQPPQPQRLKVPLARSLPPLPPRPAAWPPLPSGPSPAGGGTRSPPTHPSAHPARGHGEDSSTPVAPAEGVPPPHADEPLAEPGQGQGQGHPVAASAGAPPAGRASQDLLPPLLLPYYIGERLPRDRLPAAVALQCRLDEELLEETYRCEIHIDKAGQCYLYDLPRSALAGREVEGWRASRGGCLVICLRSQGRPQEEVARLEAEPILCSDCSDPSDPQLAVPLAVLERTLSDVRGLPVSVRLQVEVDGVLHDQVYVTRPEPAAGGQVVLHNAPTNYSRSRSVVGWRRGSVWNLETLVVCLRTPSRGTPPPHAAHAASTAAAPMAPLPRPVAPSLALAAEASVPRPGSSGLSGLRSGPSGGGGNPLPRGGWAAAGAATGAPGGAAGGALGSTSATAGADGAGMHTGTGAVARSTGEPRNTRQASCGASSGPSRDPMASLVHAISHALAPTAHRGGAEGSMPPPQAFPSSAKRPLPAAAYPDGGQLPLREPVRPLQLLPRHAALGLQQPDPKRPKPLRASEGPAEGTGAAADVQGGSAATTGGAAEPRSAAAAAPSGAARAPYAGGTTLDTIYNTLIRTVGPREGAAGPAP